MACPPMTGHVQTDNRPDGSRPSMAAMCSCRTLTGTPNHWTVAKYCSRRLLEHYCWPRHWDLAQRTDYPRVQPPVLPHDCVHVHHCRAISSRSVLLWGLPKRAGVVPGASRDCGPGESGNKGKSPGRDETETGRGACKARHSGALPSERVSCSWERLSRGQWRLWRERGLGVVVRINSSRLRSTK